jgi:DNA repair photolyase
MESRTETSLSRTADPRVQARGRGSLSQADGRYERFASTPFDDGWATFDEPSPPLRTKVTPEKSRKAITYNSSPDVGFDRSINPYQGCEHGCIYCYARPRHAFYGLSPGLDFESEIFAKHDAAEQLEKELRRPGYKPAPIALGMNTDCYQPTEKSLKITRQVLEVLNAFNHPVYIVTKSAMVLRDLDILRDMAQRNLVTVSISVTTLNRQLARRMEPRAATPPRRIDTIRTLAEAGIPTGVMVAPIIPGLTEHELDRILEEAAGAGATRAGYVMLRLPLEIRELFSEWLSEHYPDRARKVFSMIHNMRGGRANDSRFGKRMSGTGPYAILIGDRFKLACKHLGLVNSGMASTNLTLDAAQFAPPPASGDQFNLFDQKVA